VVAAVAGPRPTLVGSPETAIIADDEEDHAVGRFSGGRPALAAAGGLEAGCWPGERLSDNLRLYTMVGVVEQEYVTR
jgi:hypothetical protein